MPEPFDEYVVAPGRLAIHADGDLARQQQPDPLSRSVRTIDACIIANPSPLIAELASAIPLLTRRLPVTGTSITLPSLRKRHGLLSGLPANIRHLWFNKSSGLTDAPWRSYNALPSSAMPLRLFPLLHMIPPILASLPDLMPEFRLALAID